MASLRKRKRRGFSTRPIPEMPQRIELDFAALQARYWQRRPARYRSSPCLSFTSLKMGMAASFLRTSETIYASRRDHIPTASAAISILGRALASLTFLLVWLRQESATRSAKLRWDQGRRLFWQGSSQR